MAAWRLSRITTTTSASPRPARLRRDCELGVFSIATRQPPPNGMTRSCAVATCSAQDGARFAYGEGTSFAAPHRRRASPHWPGRCERGSPPRRWRDVIIRSARRRSAGMERAHRRRRGGRQGGHGDRRDLRRGRPRRARQSQPPATGTTWRSRVARVRATARAAGHELAGTLTYAVLVSRDSGGNFSVAAMRRRSRSAASVRLKGRKRERIAASAVCDAERQLRRSSGWAATARASQGARRG